MRSRLSCALLALCVPSWAGAATEAESKQSPAGTVAEVVRHQVKGTVRTHREGSTLAVIAHEEIPGYMEAMTMPLVVKQASELKGVKAGDQIQFRLNVTDDDCWIDEVKVTGKSVTLPASEPDTALRPIARGAVFPEFTLTDHLGNPVTPSTYRGQAYALTFIYTNCPLPTFCPRINRHYQEVQKLIAAGRPGGGKLLSVTIDPARDTVQHLNGFAASWQADPAVWRFATGRLEDITALALRSGLSFWDDQGLIQHNLRTIVVDAAGRVHQVYEDGEWTPEELADGLATAALIEAAPAK